ncbi:DNA glycosylase [Gymnopus androsaceus JB14]|uniref:DNA glycosylase n=1 Tax=Gymnopus androsaceus JB14 TaxID=1447944 RepID=A0A6A4ISI7_9AGAR|nr:DNA glycosylase [Gymnopus androsaceus JB14]
MCSDIVLILHIFRMPTTRSASRATVSSAPSAPTPRTPKRKAQEPPSAPATKEKKPRGAKKPAEVSAVTLAQIEEFQRNLPEPGPAPVFVPAKLSFRFEEAKQHLINVDPRFEILFNKMCCKPFEQLETVHPFRALVTSIVGQQISWIAARAVNHKFVRLFNPSIPEKVLDYQESKSPTSFFPTAQQVASTDLAILRTAGLSGRKAEYVRDLATRFADGRLSTEKLLQANDDELAEMLIEVKGIGRWTVDVFSIFTLRRPNILPVGDLGVQRGMLRWFLGLHSPSYSCSFSPDKTERDTHDVDDSEKEGNDTLPALGESSVSLEKALDAPPFDLSSIPPAPPAYSSEGGGEATVASLPPPATPSVEETLIKVENSQGYVPPPLPTGLSPSTLHGRLDPKKKIKGAILTPSEMEELTDSWKPYRSLGVFYMWSLAAK